MPKFRTTETPEQASGSFLGLLIVVGMLAMIVALIITSDPLPGHSLHSRVYVPATPDD